MVKVFELARKKSPTKGMFGIEIEVEGKRLPNDGFGHWKVDMDEGSLRDGGLEYVFDGPLDYEEAINEVVKLKKYIRNQGGRPVFSPRTSVHVHVNVSDLTFNEMCNFLFLSLLVEGNLAHFCGDVRKGNPFCITGKNAEGVYDAMEKIYSSKELIRGDKERVYRYGFINLMSISKYGSVEFRGMYGTLDVDVLKIWLSMLRRIKTMSKEFKTPVDIINHIDKISLDNFTDDLLPKDFRYVGQREDQADVYDILRTITLSVESWEDKKIVKKQKGKPGDNPFLAALGGADPVGAPVGEMDLDAFIRAVEGNPGLIRGMPVGGGWVDNEEE